MSELTEVEARFGADGKITVLSFTWQGRRLPVTGAGREWDADDGHHFLVMTAGERVFELVYESAGGVWRAAQVSGRTASA
jgi:hypothetical protein